MRAKGRCQHIVGQCEFGGPFVRGCASKRGQGSKFGPSKGETQTILREKRIVFARIPRVEYCLWLSLDPVMVNRRIPYLPTSRQTDLSGLSPCIENRQGPTPRNLPPRKSCGMKIFSGPKGARQVQRVVFALLTKKEGAFHWWSGLSGCPWFLEKVG
jgi:hypothetical protein